MSLSTPKSSVLSLNRAEEDYVAARLRGKGRLLVTVERRQIFLSSLYIFMFNSYFTFYNRGTSAKGLATLVLGYHRDTTAVNPVTLFI